MIKLCYREPDFPKEAYVSTVILLSKSGDKFLYPMTSLFTTLNILRLETNDFKKKLAKRKIKVHGVITIKIKFNKTYPLRKEHWTCPKDSLLDNNFRINQFMEMAGNVPQLYQIIVLPSDYLTKTKEWKFVNWIPILVSLDNKKIDDLIRASDQGVDESAKSMGLYSVEKVRGFDLDTGKFIKPSKEVKIHGADC